MEVALIRWPEEDARREPLSKARGPRLLLVEAGFDPPCPLDCLEDWVRMPAPEAEVKARVDALARRGHVHSDEGSPDVPVIDSDGVLRFNGTWTALPPLEARLTTALVDRFRSVAGREALLRAGWPRETPSRNALDVHVLRLRRRLTPLGLAIRTIRSRGYLMEAVCDPTAAPASRDSVLTGSSG